MQAAKRYDFILADHKLNFSFDFLSNQELLLILYYPFLRDVYSGCCGQAGASAAVWRLASPRDINSAFLEKVRRQPWRPHGSFRGVENAPSIRWRYNYRPAGRLGASVLECPAEGSEQGAASS
jgi:hypothetical protein